jgi:hypothetical protein
MMDYESNLMGSNYNRQELAGHVVDGHHAMRQAGIIVNGIAFVQDLHVRSDLDFQATRQNQVHFLADMGVEFDVGRLCPVS